jgi:polyphosphate kinase
MALANLGKGSAREVLPLATTTISLQLNEFGRVLRQQLIPTLEEHGIRFCYQQPLPSSLLPELESIFYNQILGTLRITSIGEQGAFFPQNNTIYLLLREQNKEGRFWIVGQAAEGSQRFFTLSENGTRHIVISDDIIRHFLPGHLSQEFEPAIYSIKITRDADLDLQDEFEGDLAEKIERQIKSRDLGFATRLLHDPEMPEEWVQEIIRLFGLQSASVMAGGPYHQLKDLAAISLPDAPLNYPAWPAATVQWPSGQSLLQYTKEKDLMLHPPYQSYDTVLRFFNEAASHPAVREIWISLYRIAGDSRIAHTLIAAARNGKQVTVFVELKARFDEANNIRWAKKMKAAGLRIVYSIPGLKVHAKLALVKWQDGHRLRYTGLFATGNFNERTAKYYTDHILLSSRPGMLRELEMLFLFLLKRRKPLHEKEISFQHLAVAQFNMKAVFLSHIQNEIQQAQAGRPAMIRIKLNNLEDEEMIEALYAASEARVRIQLLVRGICRLKPGIKGLSEHIELKRIVDRYLEHGRIFYFYNAGEPVLMAGSADWMERNIHRRIEVCFPIMDPSIKKELMELLDLQWADNKAAVWINASGEQESVKNDLPALRSQEAIWKKWQPHA